VGKEVHVVAKAPWTAGGLEISTLALAEIERAGRAAYARNEEACGYLEGPLEEPLWCDAAVELENLANKYHAVDPEAHPRTGREYFKVNSKKFERAIELGQKERRPVKVFFHSHLDCGAYFSAEDAASMTLGGTREPSYDLAYLVTAVDEGKVTAHKLFIWDFGSASFVESPFTAVVPADGSANASARAPGPISKGPA
jgi:proteasome lid subunit RPN8/RPN11